MDFRAEGVYIDVVDSGGATVQAAARGETLEIRFPYDDPDGFAAVTAMR